MTLLENRAAEGRAVEPHPRSPWRRLRPTAMRPRRVLVKAHRWLSIALLAWLVVISVTGAWLAVHQGIIAAADGDRYRATPGDVGPDVALAAAAERLPDSVPASVVMPANGRGVYQVQMVGEPAEEFVYVDPGSGEVNDVAGHNYGATWWLYRGHMHLWQDQGLFGVFNPDEGWCRVNASGHEPGGARGVVCDIIPNGDDMVAWFAVGWIAVLFSGFYLWYWPGVRRWATAFVVRRGRGRFAFNMSLHKAVGLVVWIPLTIIAFTGAAFAFPNLARWYDNATPAQRDFSLWTPPESAPSGTGGTPISLTDVVETIERDYPTREVQSLAPAADPNAPISAWVSRGFDPWTREGGGGNTLMIFDQHSGELLYDGTPEAGNVFDQAWDDWSFPLHTGDFGGASTRVLWAAVALSPLGLGATGVTMTLIRRGKRRRRAAEPSASPEALVNGIPQTSNTPYF
jgi:uncharacterized iron-regulated membrane protein